VTEARAVFARSYLLLALLLVLDVHVERSVVALVGSEAAEFGQLITVLRILNSAQFDNIAIDLLDLLELLGILLLNFVEELNEALQDNAS
jgi:hypothetical protein